MSKTTALVFYDRAREMLDKAASIDEVKDIRDRAQALRLYYRQQKDSHAMQNRCAEIKIREERRAGELLAEMEKHPGGNPNLLHAATGCPAKLSDLEIERTQSHRWQTIAAMPSEQFETHIAHTLAAGEELTSATLYRDARRQAPAADGTGLRGRPPAEVYETGAYLGKVLIHLKAQSLGLTQRQADLAAFIATLNRRWRAYYVERLKAI
jgi:hypothetical protein